MPPGRTEPRPNCVHLEADFALTECAKSGRNLVAACGPDGKNVQRIDVRLRLFRRDEGLDPLPDCDAERPSLWVASVPEQHVVSGRSKVPVCGDLCCRPRITGKHAIHRIPIPLRACQREPSQSEGDKVTVNPLSRLCARGLESARGSYVARASIVLEMLLVER
jgi:hypothetical protein